jgi:RNA polymerase sigma-70 factor (ECF subfamily)
VESPINIAISGKIASIKFLFQRNAIPVAMRIKSESSTLRSDDEPTSGRLSDEVLAARVARGNSEALESLYDRHSSMVLGLILKIVGDRAAAEDVLQETFWRVWKSADTYQPERGSFTSWLFRIARNLAIDVYRRGAVRPQVIPNGDDVASRLDQTPDPAMDVAEQAQSTIESKQVRSALSSLSGVQRQVIEMAYFYGMTRQEIAEATGEALGTIHTRARLALQKLREELETQKFEG